jgi:copper homeostasis protein
MQIEIATFSIEGAITAQEAGADRIELCCAPAEGGLTPAYGTMLLARKHLRIPLNVMIRPREGDFCYTEREFETMLLDVEAAVDAGADGIVTGLLLNDGRIDKVRLNMLIQAAGSLDVTFHRAFDMLRDPLESLEVLVDSGVKRILSSGGKRTAPEGTALLRELVTRATDRISIMPGCGISESNVIDLIEKTGAREIHLSARSVVPGRMEFRKTGISMGSGTELTEYDTILPDKARIQRIRKLINS